MFLLFKKIIKFLILSAKPTFSLLQCDYCLSKLGQMFNIFRSPQIENFNGNDDQTPPPVPKLEATGDFK